MARRFRYLTSLICSAASQASALKIAAAYERLLFLQERRSHRRIILRMEAR